MKRIWSFHAVQTSPIWKRSPKTPSKTNNWNTPSEASKIAMFILWWFVHSTDLNGSRRTKSPVPHVQFLLLVSKSHFLPSFVEAKPLPQQENSNPRREFLLPNKNPFQRITKGSCTWHGFRNRNLCFFKRPSFFFRVLGVGLLRGVIWRSVVWDSLRHPITWATWTSWVWDSYFSYGPKILKLKTWIVIQIWSGSWTSPPKSLGCFWISAKNNGRNMWQPTSWMVFCTPTMRRSLN